MGNGKKLEKISTDVLWEQKVEKGVGEKTLEVFLHESAPFSAFEWRDSAVSSAFAALGKIVGVTGEILKEISKAGWF